MNNKKPTKQPRPIRETTRWSLKLILILTLTVNKPQNAQNSEGGDFTQERPLDLTHDNRVVNLPGSAYPIKLATMSTDRKKIRDNINSRKILCIKIRILEILMEHTILKTLSTLLSGIAYLGGKIHGTATLIIKNWIATLETALAEFEITMMSFLHTETTEITCPFFKLLIGLLRSTHLQTATSGTFIAITKLLRHAVGAAINDLKESLTSLLNDESANYIAYCNILKVLIKITIHISLKKYAVERSAEEYIRLYQTSQNSFFPTPEGEHGAGDINENNNEVTNGTESEKYLEKERPGGKSYFYSFDHPPEDDQKTHETRPQGNRPLNPNAEDFIPNFPQTDTQETQLNGDEILDEDEIFIEKNVHCRTKIMTINVRSAVSDERKVLIRRGVKKLDPDIIIITETWFCENDGEFIIQGYSPIARCDRQTEPGKTPKTQGGGVMALAKNDIEFTLEESIPISRNIQIVRFVIGITTIFGVYRTGDAEVHHKMLTNWLEKELTKLGTKPYIITGDLNLRELAKVDFNPTLKPVGVKGQKRTTNHRWSELLKAHAIEQHVDVATHKQGNILDYVFAPEHVTNPLINVAKIASETSSDPNPCLSTTSDPSQELHHDTP